MKAAIYARVSDDKLKADGDRRQDIERQVDKLMKWAKVQSFEIGPADIFRDDGISAFKDDYQSRPAFVKLLREIRGRHYNVVLVEDLTRWARRIDDGLKTLKTASDFGCTITSLHEGESDVTTANGWFRCALAFMIAEWASRSMSDKVKSGMARRLDDKDKICKACGVVHMGRHPASCQCKNCRRRNHV